MIQAIMLLPKRGRHPHERAHLNETPNIKIPHDRQRQAGARLLKHEVSRRGPMIECIKCGQFWESTATNLILAQGMCPGPKIYGDPQYKRERPWTIPAKRGRIWWGKHKLHTSHRAAWYRGVIVCSGCGHFSLKGQSLRGLAKICCNSPASRYCQMTMKLIRHGTKRAGFTDWPPMSLFLHTLAWTFFGHFFDIVLRPQCSQFWCPTWTQLGPNLAPKSTLVSIPFWIDLQSI